MYMYFQNNNKETKRNSDLFYISALCFWIVLFYSTFLLTLLPPQYGWWNYYAQRLSEGAFLYKDLYCFLMPYYVWLQTGFYYFFGNEVLLYYIVGVIFELIAAIIVFRLLCRMIHPVWALLFSFSGAVLQYSYLMYFPLDYNVLIADFVIVAIYIVSLALFKKHTGLFLLGGFLFGFVAMMKQTLFILIIVAACMLFYAGEKKYSKNEMRKPLICFFSGVALSVIPGILFLSSNNTLFLLFDLMMGAGKSKGSLMSILYRFIFYGLPFVELSCAILIVYYICRPSFSNHSWSFMSLNGHKYLFLKVFSLGTLLLLLKKAFLFLNSENFAVLSLALCIFYLTYYYVKSKSIDISTKFIDIFVISKMNSVCHFFAEHFIINSFIIGTALILLCKYYGFDFRRWLFVNGSVYHVKTILINIVFWVLFIYNLSLLVRLHLTKKWETLKEEQLFSIIYVCFVSMHFLSTAWMEELFIMPVFALVMALLFRRSLISNKIITQGVLIVVVIFVVFTAITQKQLMPYNWWCWSSVGLNNSDKVYVNSKISGLKGFTFDVDTEEAYENIIDAINLYSKRKDRVFNFPHIPLFNILTNRSTGMYAVAYYFDVCPDSIAALGEMQLRKNPPKMVIWNDFSPDIWNRHETVFRGGKRSGQRDILSWYDSVVVPNYCLVYQYKMLKVWAQDSNNFLNLRFAQQRLNRRIKLDNYLNNDCKDVIIINWDNYKDIINSAQTYSVDKCLREIFVREKCFSKWSDERRQKLLNAVLKKV